MYTTTTLRKHDAGVVFVGDPLVALGLEGPVGPYEAGPLPIGSVVHRQATCPSGCTNQFKEPIMSPTFFPTYKKNVDKKTGKPREFIPVTEKGWFESTYNIMHKEHWYKKGGVKKV